MSEAVLYYFNNRGYGECIRMMLCVTKTKFREVLMEERSQQVELLEKGRLQFEQVPLLEMDGMDLVQSRAILRYLANKGGMLGGGNPKTTAKIDMLFEGTRDLYEMYVNLVFTREPEKDVLAHVASAGLPRYLPIYNKLLGNSGTGFLVGSSLSLADVGLFEVLQLTVEYFGEDALKEYEHLKKFYDMMISQPDMKVYLEKYKKPLNTLEIVETVEKVLNRCYALPQK